MAWIETLETTARIEPLKTTAGIEASGTAEPDATVGVGRRDCDRRQQNRGDGNDSQSSKHSTIPGDQSLNGVSLAR